MAYPVIKFAVGGSDTEASGAGPTTALFGTDARTINSAGEVVVFFIGTKDLSEVATDGSHAVYLNISTAGQRNFSSIIGKWDNNPIIFSDTGSIAATSTDMTVADSSIYTTGSVYVVAGAGPAGVGFYGRVASKPDAVTVRFSAAADTTVVAAVVSQPDQVTLGAGEGLNTGGTDVSWAIGGKRATLTSGTNSRKLLNNNGAAGDAMGGWILEMESGFTDTNASTISMARDGSSTLPGPVIRGVYGAAVMPIISWTATSGACFSVASADQVTFANFEMRATSATKAGQIAITVGVTTQVLGMKIDHATDYFGVGLSGAGNNLYVNGCSLKNFSQTTPASPSVNHAIVCTSSDYITIVNNRIHNALGCGLTFGGSTMTAPTISGNVISHCGRHAIYPTTTGSATANARGIRMWNNTLAYNTGDALRLDVDATSTAYWLGFYCFNNLFTHNTGYAINCTDTSPTVTAEIFAQAGGVKDVLYCNNFYSNTAGNIFPAALNTDLAQPGGLAVDPRYTNAATYNFTPNNTALAGTAYPTNLVEQYPGGIQPEGGATTLRNRGF